MHKIDKSHYIATRNGQKFEVTRNYEHVATGKTSKGRWFVSWSISLKVEDGLVYVGEVEKKRMAWSKIVQFQTESTNENVMEQEPVEVVEEVVSEPAIDYASMNRDELREVAKKLQIVGRGKLNKADLLKAVLASV